MVKDITETFVEVVLLLGGLLLLAQVVKAAGIRFNVPGFSN